METSYFDDVTYSNLLGVLTAIDAEEGTELAITFASFFTEVDGFYAVTNLTGYTNWIMELLDGDDASEWFAWDGTITIKSTEWGGQG